jgi:hypothetical protein
MELLGCSDSQSEGAVNFNGPVATADACADAGFIAGNCDAWGASSVF